MGRINNGRAYFFSPAGLILIESSGAKITALRFVRRISSSAEKTAIIKKALRELSEYFYKHRKKFTLPLKFSGTDFQIKVWKELCKIPRGGLISYKELAAKIGRPRAARAVANACGLNKIAVIVPCHRVVASV